MLNLNLVTSPYVPIEYQANIGSGKNIPLLDNNEKMLDGVISMKPSAESLTYTSEEANTTGNKNNILFMLAGVFIGGLAAVGLVAARPYRAINDCSSVSLGENTLLPSFPSIEKAYTQGGSSVTESVSMAEPAAEDLPYRRLRTQSKRQATRQERISRSEKEVDGFDGLRVSYIKQYITNENFKNERVKLIEKAKKMKPNEGVEVKDTIFLSTGEKFDCRFLVYVVAHDVSHGIWPFDWKETQHIAYIKPLFGLGYPHLMMPE